MGGMGRVYRVRDLKLDEIVALKIVRRDLLGQPGVIERFMQEVKLARRVTNEHVVRTFDLGQHGADQFLTMEYVEGQSLTRVLDDGPPSLAETLRIARAMCTGIAAAHAAGVLHRDLKPDNVLVATTGRIAITDFGIALVSSEPVRVEDRFIGTPAYMAPEQVTGEAIGPPTDIYALGAILFEMLAGRRPFFGTSPVAMAVARLQEPVPDPRDHRDVPAALATIVKKCLAREPTGRYADGGALSRALAAIDLVGSTPGAGPVRPSVPTTTSRTVAVLPLQAVPELAEVADGLGEEIVDGLSMTRDLRVRPFASVRAALAATAGTVDPRTLGARLDVDVVVEGSLKKAGELVRITARVIGVADGFQLWANRVDTRTDGLLTAGDQIAQAVARALTVEIAMPARPAANARATEQYLEGKARLRASWNNGVVAEAIELLESSHQLEPTNAAVVATLALALARSGFGGVSEHLTRARHLAERATALAPGDGDAWVALGVAHLYAGASGEGVTALLKALDLVPGHALAQGTLGAVLLEASAIEEGVAHLEAAVALDPSSGAAFDTARAYMYTGRSDEAFQLLARIPDRLYAETSMGRFKMWLGETYQPAVRTGTALEVLTLFGDAMREAFSTRAISPAGRDKLARALATESKRLRSAFAQFATEALVFVGDPDAAFETLELAIAAGTRDDLWMTSCPLLAPLRSRPRFAELAALVRERVEAVLAALKAR